jgi:hypothetical protein
MCRPLLCKGVKARLEGARVKGRDCPLCVYVCMYVCILCICAEARLEGARVKGRDCPLCACVCMNVCMYVCTRVNV